MWPSEYINATTFPGGTTRQQALDEANAQAIPDLMTEQQAIDLQAWIASHTAPGYLPNPVSIAKHLFAAKVNQGEKALGLHP